MTHREECSDLGQDPGIPGYLSKNHQRAPDSFIKGEPRRPG